MKTALKIHEWAQTVCIYSLMAGYMAMPETPIWYAWDVLYLSLATQIFWGVIVTVRLKPWRSQ